MRAGWNGALVVLITCVFFSNLLGAQANQEAGTDPAASSTPAPPSDADKEMAANLDKARKTLKFGIDSMVISVINQSRDNKDKRLVPEIMDAMDSLNTDVQTAAIDFFIALKDWTPHSKIAAMLDSYNDYPVVVVNKLLKFLQEEKAPAPPSLLEQLIQMSQSAKVDLQTAAVDAISACGTVDQMEGLIKLFKKSGTASSVRSAIIRAIGKFPTADGTNLLKEIVGDTGEEKSLRYESITALGKQGQNENLLLIKPSLKSKDVYERGAAINALAGFGIELVLPLYQQALRDELWRNRISVLKIINEKKLLELEAPVMFVAEDDPEKPVKSEAIRTLASLDGENGWALLRKLFLEPKTGDEIRGLIAEQLIGKNFKSSKDAIKTVMEAEWSKEKSWLLDVLCRELSTIKDPVAVEMYDKMLGHNNFVIKIYGVRGIKENAKESYRSRLQEMLDAKPAPALKSTLEDALK